ncbi:MAG: phosphoribosylamine--glycine ligase [Acidimicrobiaceae bacterium]|nr:phosphoribosylamine--glycine ligase [Acidimicrobiaceae bacterium]
MSRCVVVGSGAREHALAWALAKSCEVVVSPGNAGMAAHGFTCVDTPATELDADLFVIGPEQPLVEGLADALRAQGKRVFGPGRDASQLEGSKAFMKDFLASAGVPTARYATFSDPDSALSFLDSMSAPYVVKTDGLASGKGVLVTHDLAQARDDVLEKLSGRAFGGAGTTVVIEEGLAGHECSLIVLCDGTDVVALAPAQDFKRVGDADQGANTGGMGAYAPMTSMTPDQVDNVMREIVLPTVAELRRRGIDFRGVLYAGLMLGPYGAKLLEYNVRFGDPETQVLAPLYGDALFDLLKRTSDGRLGGSLAVPSGAAVTVVLAASGYPRRPRVGDVISGLGDDGQLAEEIEGVIVFHAGTQRSAGGVFTTFGGRVLAVTGTGASLEEARRRAYQGAALVTFDGMVMRTDIALGAH